MCMYVSLSVCLNRSLLHLPFSFLPLQTSRDQRTLSWTLKVCTCVCVCVCVCVSKCVVHGFTHSITLSLTNSLTHMHAQTYTYYNVYSMLNLQNYVLCMLQIHTHTTHTHTHTHTHVYTPICGLWIGYRHIHVYTGCPNTWHLEGLCLSKWLTCR